MGARRALVIAATLWFAGCGLSLDVDPRPPTPTGMDAGRDRRDSGRDMRDGDIRPPDSAVIDAGPPVDAQIRDCVNDSDCNVPCRTGRTCDAMGRCSAGDPRDCNDDNFCTVDSCSPTGCVNEPPSTDPCDDMDPCNGVELCVGGPDATAACAPGAEMTCDDTVACTVDSCTSGTCVHMPDDGACTLAGGGGMSGTCDPMLGCQYSMCDDATCGTNECETGSCVSGTCERAPRCLAGEMCCGGHCVDAGCDDGNPCTADRCGMFGCEHVDFMDGTPCPTTDRCVAGAECASGMCVPRDTLACDDGNPCTNDRCDRSTGCVFAPLPDDSGCNDGDPCTVGEYCEANTCKYGVSPCRARVPGSCAIEICMGSGAAYTCVPDMLPAGDPCGAQMHCDATRGCICDTLFSDCDRNASSCECLVTNCNTTTRTCLLPVDPCFGRLCGGGVCCPTTGACYLPACTTCCPPATS